ncbi:MAG: DUF488 family protein [Neisseria sp.]|uniref:DUF488 domain-containing protein n=1 Tax=Neisseria sp. TaxID=192066 RepID=UPI0026DD307F|nr:DUF488 family protein [Neisseria sp.]MDO4641919.1 DUF488 family protein [Neisseria sp.]
MYTVQRIYDFHILPAETCAVFIDRLYPRGLAKARMQHVIWLKDIAPSAELRRWYHTAPAERYQAFAARYLNELVERPATVQALAELHNLAEQHHEIRLLSAVKNPQQSHVAVLLNYLGEPFRTADPYATSENGHI